MQNGQKMQIHRGVLGSVLGRSVLKEYIEKGLIDGFLDLNTQLQPNGFDMTLDAVFSISGQGVIDFDNSSRSLPSVIELLPDNSGRWALGQGIYRIRYAESVNLPLHICALGRPRSSLIRCGVSVETAVWDAGYSGRSESLLIVHNPHGVILSKRARVMQLVFFYTGEVMQGYSGAYNKENMNK
ncbi:MAG: deoxyuridine 5'-triphosphate nucleotidohydrolase [Thermoplasmata archaeon]